MSNQENKSGKKGRGVAFVLGITIGAVTTYFLTTEEGKKWRKETSKRVGEFAKRLSKQAQEQFEQFAERVEVTTEAASEYLDNGNGATKSKPMQAVKSESPFQRGMQKAKNESDKRRQIIDEEIEDI
ncbi:MAG: YtxH domain-containing protein [Saprospiraceae bacterium]|nr:YtxH domain-containing protein [Saprospiraceae bacterium]